MQQQDEDAAEWIKASGQKHASSYEPYPYNHAGKLVHQLQYCKMIGTKWCMNQNQVVEMIPRWLQYCNPMLQNEVSKQIGLNLHTIDQCPCSTRKDPANKYRSRSVNEHTQTPALCLQL